MPIPPPSHKAWDHKGPILRRDDTVDTSLVGYEAGQCLDAAHAGMEVSDFFVVLGHKLSLVPDTLLGFTHLLGEEGGAMVDGGDEAIGRGADGGAEVVVFEEEVLGLLCR